MPGRGLQTTRLRAAERRSDFGRLAYRRSTLLVIAIAALLVAACGGDGVEREDFDLTASDGFVFPAEVTLSDDSVHGVWVLLGHQFTGNRRDWDSLRDDFLDRDLTVMTWDFRCHGEAPCETETKGESVEQIWREWMASLDYAVAQGATTIYAAGASMGGTSLIQVAADRPEIDALAIVSSPNRFKGLDALANYERVTIPKIFVVGRADNFAPVFSRRYHEQATGPSRLVMLETELHGTTLVQDKDWGPIARGHVVEFFDDPATMVTLASIDLGPIPGGPGDDSADTEQSQTAQAQTSAPPQDVDDDSQATTSEPAPGAVPNTDVVDVILRTEDGLDLAANLRPGGPVWILLGHQNGGERGGWGELDGQLHADGYSVLAWDFRGHGDSPAGDLSDLDLDWAAAIDHAEDSGAMAIYAVGASMGGTSALTVAGSDARIDGVVTISAPAQFVGFDGGAAVPEVSVPMLFMAGTGDRSAFSGLELFRGRAEQAGLSHDAITYDSSLHGNALVRDSVFGAQVHDEILAWLPSPDGTPD